MFLEKENLIHICPISSESFFDNDLNVLVAGTDGIDTEHLSAFSESRMDWSPMFELYGVFAHEQINQWRIGRVSMLANETETLVELAFPFQRWQINDYTLRQPFITHP